MKKGKEFYEFSNFEECSQNDKTSVIKIIILALLVVITIALAFITINVNENIQIANKRIAEQKEIDRIKQENIKLEKEKQEAERKRQEKLPKLTEEGKANIESIYSSETKRAFLTFDDGPSDITPIILETLKKENIKASFFMLGTRVKQKPEITKQVYNEGHFIGNHGYSHQYSSIYASPEAVLNEYNLCNNSIKDALGEQEYNSHLFRFPGGLARRKIC